MESEPSGDRKKVNLAGVAVVVAGAGVGAAVVGAAVVGTAVVGGVVPASVVVLPGRQERVIIHVKCKFSKCQRQDQKKYQNERGFMQERKR